MRERLRPLRAREMAHRLGSEGRFDLSPRARRIAGWIAAFLLLIIIAVVFRLLGGNGDGTVVAPTPSSGTNATATIRFGTGFDPGSGEVAVEAETSRFAAGDTFAYSISPSGTPAALVYVEVIRTAGGPIETAQKPVDPQPTDPRLIAFDVPADNLISAFGPGQYRMLIYEDPAGDPIAAGEFELVGAVVSPSASP